MKFGLQVIHAWSKLPKGEENVPRFLLELAVKAEEAGWKAFLLWDHLFFPWVVPMADPWTVLAAASSMTKRIKLGTTVTPITRRRPQVLAKQLATLDHLSNGRVVLGAGLGGDGKSGDAGREFSAFGEESRYTVLAEKADEALEIITGLWTGAPFTFKDRHYTVDDVTLQPAPVQKPRIPIWIGGNSAGALRRAAKYDGWTTGGPCPSAGDPGLTLEEVHERFERIMRYRNTGEPFDVSYALEFPDDGEEMEELVSGAESVGVTWMLESIFGLRFNGDQALERVRQGPPDL